jgi:hypothetical protein
MYQTKEDPAVDIAVVGKCSHVWMGGGKRGY